MRGWMMGPQGVADDLLPACMRTPQRRWLVLVPIVDDDDDDDSVCVQANDNWRNLMGLLFSTCVAILFTAAIANMVRFPLEWTVVAREYLGGSNAMGPYIAAKLVYDLPYCYGPCLLAIVLYWMTGREGGRDGPRDHQAGWGATQVLRSWLAGG